MTHSTGDDTKSGNPWLLATANLTSCLPWPVAIAVAAPLLLFWLVGMVRTDKKPPPRPDGTHPAP